jgi:hypothetical protein
MLEEGEGDHRHQRMTMQALPGSALEVIETEFFFQLLVRLQIHRALMVAAKVAGPSLPACGWAITLAALTVTGGLFAQTGPPQRRGFDERIKAVASSFKSDPSLKKLSQTQLENLMNFVVGNMLFVLITKWLM